MPSVPLGTNLLGPNEEPFKTTDLLGHGAFGEVYRAVGETSGIIVAVKLLPIGVLASSDSIIALMNEIKTAQQISHPNVVRVLSVNDGNSSSVGPYIIMEYASGGTLARFLRAQEQSGTQILLTRAVEIMVDLAQGARAINEKIIHRDIKPDNILLEGNTFKIADFGISKFVDETTRTHTFKGGQHIAYMAPEGWQNLANTFKLDVYSVGLVFHQVLATKHPLLSKVKDPDNFLDWEKAHLYEQCPDIRDLREDVPLALAQLLGRMVGKRASERPGWDEILTILTQPTVVNSKNQNPSIEEAVVAAVARRQQIDRDNLRLAEEKNEREKESQLYRYSCERLLQEFRPLVDQFNETFQHGKITCTEGPGFFAYHIPLGRTIQVSFFRPIKPGIKIRNGEAIGGGWIGLSKGRSANLVLLKHGDDDLYGQWVVCEVGIMAIADPRKLIGKFGLTEGMPLPFGFKDAYFYDQIRYATGTMHVFTYTFIDDVRGHFANLIRDACS